MVAERFGAQGVLADRLQHAAERRVDDAQQRQEQDDAGEEDEIVAYQPPIDGDAEDFAAHQPEARPQPFGNLERAAVLAAGELDTARRAH